MRLLADKAKTDFAHPLGVKPKHRKIVRIFGQVCTHSVVRFAAVSLLTQVLHSSL